MKDDERTADVQMAFLDLLCGAADADGRLACEFSEVLTDQVAAHGSQQEFLKYEELSVRIHTQDPQIAKREADSISHLREQLNDILHHARSLLDFDAWLGSGRRPLFERYCRFTPEDAWLSSADQEAGVTPIVFLGDTAESVSEHLEHCSLCWIGKRLAEGRRRAGTDKPLLRGDQLVDVYIRRLLREAFHRRDEDPHLFPGRILIPPNLPLEVNLRVSRQAPRREGDALTFSAELDNQLGEACRVELHVTAELVTRVGANPIELAFPNDSHDNPILTLQPRTPSAIDLRVAAPQAEGDFLFRYAICALGEDLAPQFRSWRDSSPDGIRPLDDLGQEDGQGPRADALEATVGATCLVLRSTKLD